MRLDFRERQHCPEEDISLPRYLTSLRSRPGDIQRADSDHLHFASVAATRTVPAWPRIDVAFPSTPKWLASVR